MNRILYIFYKYSTSYVVSLVALMGSVVALVPGIIPVSFQHRMVVPDLHLLLWISIGFLTLLCLTGRFEKVLAIFLPQVFVLACSYHILSFLNEKMYYEQLIPFSLWTASYGLIIAKKVTSQVTLESKIVGEKWIGLSYLVVLLGVGLCLFIFRPYSLLVRPWAYISIMSSLVIILIMAFYPVVFFRLIYFKGKRRYLPLTISNLLLGTLTFLIFLISSQIFTILGIVPIPGNKKRKKKIFSKILMLYARFFSRILLNVRWKKFNPNRERFRKPAVIIFNHQSFLDSIIMLGLTPRLLIFTNDWVDRSSFTKILMKFTELMPVYEGVEGSLDRIEEKVKAGYSIAIFPEGSVKPGSRIRRFHKGGFLIAEKLNMDIVPVVNSCMGEMPYPGEVLLKKGKVIVRILDRIIPENDTFGKVYSERAKLVRGYVSDEYEKIRVVYDTPFYFREKLIRSYMYKSGELEWLCRFNLRSWKNFETIHSCIPAHAKITEYGCGYGFMTYMLSFLSDFREITGIDRDKEKIALATGSVSNSDRTRFLYCDMVSHLPDSCDIFIFHDFFCALKPEIRNSQIIRCVNSLRGHGKIILLTKGFQRNSEPSIPFFREMKKNNFAEDFMVCIDEKYLEHGFVVLAKN